MGKCSPLLLSRVPLITESGSIGSLSWWQRILGDRKKTLPGLCIGKGGGVSFRCSASERGGSFWGSDVVLPHSLVTPSYVSDPSPSLSLMWGSALGTCCFHLWALYWLHSSIGRPLLHPDILASTYISLLCREIRHSSQILITVFSLVVLLVCDVCFILPASLSLPSGALWFRNWLA